MEIDGVIETGELREVKIVVDRLAPAVSFADRKLAKTFSKTLEEVRELERQLQERRIAARGLAGRLLAVVREQLTNRQIAELTGYDADKD